MAATCGSCKLRREPARALASSSLVLSFWTALLYHCIVCVDHLSDFHEGTWVTFLQLESPLSRFIVLCIHQMLHLSKLDFCNRKQDHQCPLSDLHAIVQHCCAGWRSAFDSANILGLGVFESELWHLGRFSL